MDLKLGKYWAWFVGISAALILLTVLLAVYYAPIAASSVKTANELLPSIEGSRITVSGFVADRAILNPIRFPEDPPVTTITLADFSDYHRYLDAVAAGDLDGEWWTVEPIIVRAPFFPEGTNVSVTAEVVATNGSPSFMLSCDSSSDVVELSSPGEAGIMTSPISQKIFYFHMPAAWVSYVGFFLTLIFGIAYLRTRERKYDRVASSSAELGVLFATIAIATGPIWAKEEWGVYWRWDDTKLVTTFVMWLVYIGYLMLRAAVVDQNVRARISAVYGILGFVTMPMSLLSSRIAPLIRSSHPQVIASSGGGLSTEAGITIGVAVVAFTFLFITMLIKRVEIEESDDELEELKHRVGGEE